MLFFANSTSLNASPAGTGRRSASRPPSTKALTPSRNGARRQRCAASRSSVSQPSQMIRRALTDRKEKKMSQASVRAEDLPYRPCVGVMILNRDGLLWAGRRIPDGNSEYDGSPQLWQMPQGGIDKGEDPLEAA